MSQFSQILHPSVVVVGGGPAGLTAAWQLREAGIDDVMVVDRESQLGGIPRHCAHIGYGIRDLKRVMSGPSYARYIVRRAEKAGVDMRSKAMVTGWEDERSLALTTPEGRIKIDAGAVVLATGARERPRSARMVVGDRPAGIYTTGLLQNDVHLYGQKVGKRAVIVGAQLVSWSAVMTLRKGGCKDVVMLSERAHPEAYALFTYSGKIALGVDLQTHTKVVAVHGKPRVQAVEVEDTRTGERHMIECDTVIFTGDWIADNELARMAGIRLDERSSGILVDSSLRTSLNGVFAAGNVAHPVDTADGAALDGVHVAKQVASYLRSGGAEPPAGEVGIHAGAGLDWVSPGRMRKGDPLPARGKFLAWPSEYHPLPTIQVRVGGALVNEHKSIYPASPGRVFRIPATLLQGLRPGEDVEISLA